MGLIDFQITLNQPQDIYYCGQEVSGTLSFRTTKEKRMRGIEIKLHGQAYVHWSERVSTGRRKGDRRHYHNSEEYLNEHLYVLGGPDEDMTLPPGGYSYPFRFTLPLNLPPSFEGTFGHIRYVIKGKIVRPWRFDHRCKRAFTVVTPLDLNKEVGIQEPDQRSIEKVLCCGCCASGAMTFVVNLPFRGFVPGQRAAAVVEVDNPTNERVALKCELLQKIIYTASGGRKKTSQNILESETLGVLQGRGSMTQKSNLRIPAVPVSLQQLCSCINIEYFLQVRGSLSRVHVDPTIAVPIVVGTIPLRTQFQFIATPSPADPSFLFNPSAPPEGPSVPALLLKPTAPAEASPESPPAYYPMYPELPPPSYEECMSGKANIRSEEDDEYVQGDMEFAPKYPMYRFK